MTIHSVQHVKRTCKTNSCDVTLLTSEVSDNTTSQDVGRPIKRFLSRSRFFFQQSLWSAVNRRLNIMWFLTINLKKLLCALPSCKITTQSSVKTVQTHSRVHAPCVRAAKFSNLYTPHTPTASCQCSCRQLNSHETHFQWDSDHDCLSQQRAVAPLPARCHQHSDKTPGTNLTGFHNLPRPLQVSRSSAGDQQVASRAAQASIL